MAPLTLHNSCRPDVCRPAERGILARPFAGLRRRRISRGLKDLPHGRRWFIRDGELPLC
jgi:hypothetical protein